MICWWVLVVGVGDRLLPESHGAESVEGLLIEDQK